MRVLFIINELNSVCGVSAYNRSLLQGLIADAKQSGNEYIILTGGGDAIDKFRNLGLEIYVNKNLRHEGRNYTGYLKGLFFLKSFIKNHKIDLINAHHHYASSIAYSAGRTALLKKRRIPLILTNHGILPEIGKLNHFSADYIAGVSGHVIGYIIENKIKEKEFVRLIRYGIKVNTDVKMTESDKPRILAASRLTEDKGLDIYIRAVSILPEEYRHKADFFIAGKGNYEDTLQKLNIELNSGIEFLGPVSDMRGKLFSNDIFIMPSRAETEGFPISLVEAGLAENLVITSGFKGIDDVFEDGKDGLMFKVNDAEELAGKIIYAVDNFQDMKLLARNFGNKILRMFDYDTMIKKTLGLFEEAAKK